MQARGLLAVLWFLPWALACSREPCQSEQPKKGPVVRLDVSLETCNATPIAHIRAPDRIRKKMPIAIDASLSTDPNGDSLSYQWSILSEPRASHLTLDGPTQGSTAFTPEHGGTYEVGLVVSDGELRSIPVEAAILVDNVPPIAIAGDDFPSPLGMPATVDGSMSTDADADTLTYAWSFKSRPQGSLATLDYRTSPRPHFTPDVYGAYELSLIVNDGDIDSAEDVVRVGGGVTGGPPTAEAGNTVAAVIGLLSTIDGSGSFDPDGDAITYSWRVATKPPRSIGPGTFIDPTVAQPLFRPDKEGTYVLELVVDDGFFASPADTVEVTTVVGTGQIGDPCEPLGCPMFSVCEAGFCVPRGGCGTKTEAGSDLPETHVFDLGQSSGTFELLYETYSQEDQISVSYEGNVLYSTGCVGANGVQTISYSGTETTITVTIRPNCKGGTGTAWEFQVNCPM